MANLKRSIHYGGASTTKNKRGRLETEFKRGGGPTALPGGALHTSGSVGWYSIKVHSVRTIIQATKPIQSQKNVCEVALLAYHRASGG